MNNHNADPSKKVLSAEQTRAMAEIFAEQQGWKSQIKRGMSINDDGTLHIINGSTGKFVDVDLNDLNIAMEVLKSLCDTTEGRFRYSYKITYPDVGNHCVSIRIFDIRDDQPADTLELCQTHRLFVTVDVGKGQCCGIVSEVGSTLPIAIAEALMQITKE